MPLSSVSAGVVPRETPMLFSAYAAVAYPIGGVLGIALRSGLKR